MAGFDIGLSGIKVAQLAIELVGNNIANAATEGYHRQELNTSAIASSSTNTASNGVQVDSVDRIVDLLLEREIALQQPRIAQNKQELDTLSLLENSLGELGSQGLADALDGFYNTASELASQPDSDALRYQFVWAADALADQFHSINKHISDLESQVRSSATNTVTEANNLIKEIAGLNQEIEVVNGRNGNPSDLRDQRDQAIVELGELIDIEVGDYTDPSGVVNVAVWGTPIVSGTNYTELQVETVGEREIGVSVVGAAHHQTAISGGKLGGLFALKNRLLPEVRDKFDKLASEIITQSNTLHTRGIGTNGSFTELTGVPVLDSEFSEWSEWGSSLEEGTFKIRVNDSDTGQSSLHEISVDGSTTIEDVVTQLDAITGVDAGTVGGSLRIASSDDSRYSYDFLPIRVLDTASTGWSGPTPNVDGVYSGESDDTFTFTVTGSGAAGDEVDVGVDQDIMLEARNADNELLKSFNIGSGYAAGDMLNLENGIKVSLPMGTMKIGEEFKIEAPTNSDTSGFLAAAGINTFFTGDSASSMEVSTRVLEDPRAIATSLTSDGTDNSNIRQLASFGESEIGGLNDVSPTEYLQQIISDVGHDVSFRTAKQESMEGTLDQLLTKRDGISGVDVNEEAARLLVYQNMFQSVAKFMSTQKESLQSLMQII